MFVEGASAPQVAQTKTGRFVGVLHDRVEGRQVFGPYDHFDELIACMSDYLTRELRRVQVEQVTEVIR